MIEIVGEGRVGVVEETIPQSARHPIQQFGILVHEAIFKSCETLAKQAQLRIRPKTAVRKKWEEPAEKDPEKYNLYAGIL